MKHRTLAMIVIFSLVPLGPLAIDVYLPSIPQMVDVFSASTSDLQFSIAIYVFAVGLFQLIAGPVSDRFGRKTSAMLGLGFYALGSLLVVFSTSLSMLYIARVLQGMGASFTMVTAFAWVRDHYDGEAAGKWLSYMGGMTSVIPTVAPMLGGILALAWGWQAGFIAMTATAVILLGLAMFAFEGRKHQDVSADFSDTEKLSCNLKDIATNPQFRIYSLANLFSFGGLLTYIATAPIVAMKEGGLSEISFALLFGIIGVCQMIASLLAPRLVAQIGQRQIVRVGLILALLGGIGLILIPDSATYSYFGLAALGSGGFSIMVGTASSLNLEPFKHCAGLAASIEGFMRMVGGAVIAAAITSLALSSTVKLAVALMLTLLPLVFVHRDIVLNTRVSTSNV